MKILITGGAGFVGSNLTKVLLDRGETILSIDNFILGQKRYIEPFLEEKNYSFVEVDLLDKEKILPYFENIDLVIHLAANSDISKGAKFTNIDLDIGTIATYNVLESMRIQGVKKIIFASTSAIYGVAKVTPTVEDSGPLLPISLYGASKLACEGLITAFSHNYDIQAWIYRFGNVIGRNATHGAAYDFVNRLMANPKELTILGNGKQRKPYIHVDDLIDGMLFGFEQANEMVNYYNLSTSGNSNVTYIAECIVKHMGLENVAFAYTGGDQGWRGDVPQVELGTEKITKLGWKPRFTSDEAVIEGTKEIVEQLYHK